MGMLLCLLAVIALIAFWCYQFVLLMLMDDDIFPGSYDKIIWGVLFCFAAPLAPFVFVLWRQAILAASKDQP